MKNFLFTAFIGMLVTSSFFLSFHICNLFQNLPMQVKMNTEEARPCSDGDYSTKWI